MCHIVCIKLCLMLDEWTAASHLKDHLYTRGLQNFESWRVILMTTSSHQPLAVGFLLTHHPSPLHNLELSQIAADFNRAATTEECRTTSFCTWTVFTGCCGFVPLCAEQTQRMKLERGYGPTTNSSSYWPHGDYPKVVRGKGRVEIRNIMMQIKILMLFGNCDLKIQILWQNSFFKGFHKAAILSLPL